MSILKDSKGFIWIGTLDGLNRYDGKKIKVYRYSIEDPNSLGANEQYGHINNDPLIENHFSRDWEHSIFQRSMQVLTESKEKNIPTAEIALKIA